MPSLPIYDRTGNEVGKYDIEPEEIAPRISKQLMHDAVVMYQANLRQGSAKTKSRAEVAGSTKKMYRQKGTGNARAGSRRSGVRRGGGHIFAKQPRDFSYRINRKAAQAATRMAIASKIADDEIVVLDELSMDSPKTKEVAAMLKSLSLGETTTLIAVESYDANVYKSARNIEGVTISPVSDLNALSVLSPRRMLITRAALDAVKAKASGGNQAAASDE
jgi:large subunit ribosomal protein L4